MNGIKPTESIIAYIDFLGTSKKIEQDDDNSYLTFLKSIYDFIEKELNNINKSYANEHYIKEIKIRSFSDNILFSVSANVKNMRLVSALDEIIKICSAIQAKALKEGILIRGGIALDDIYINKHFAYGKGLLKVLEMEEKIAHYPRIILDNQLNIKCKDYYESNKKTTVDFDNIRYIDFYRATPLTDDDLKQCRKSLNVLKRKNKNNLRHMSKIQWAIQHYNNNLSYLSYQKDILGSLFPLKELPSPIQLELDFEKKEITNAQ